MREQILGYRNIGHDREEVRALMAGFIYESTKDGKASYFYFVHLIDKTIREVFSDLEDDYRSLVDHFEFLVED